MVRSMVWMIAATAALLGLVVYAAALVRRCPAPTRLRLYMSIPDRGTLWSKTLLPSNYEQVEKLMAEAVSDALDDPRHSRRLSIDLLTPGLNPKLEQKAMLFQEYLFDLVVALIPVLSERFKDVLFAFPSTGKRPLSTLSLHHTSHDRCVD